MELLHRMVARETSLADGLRQLGVADPPTIDLLARFGDLLLSRAIPRGYLGPGEQDRLVPRHLLDAVTLAAHLDSNGPIVDVGSGAGLPGVVLAAMDPRRPVTLLEASARRAGFLREVVHELGLGSVEIVQSRAEDFARGPTRESACVGTARALASPLEALELVLPLVRVGGMVGLPVGEEEGRRVDALSAGAARLGGDAVELRRIEVPGMVGARWVMIVRKIRPTPDRFPRSPSARRRRSVIEAVE